jgi:MFS family permease
MAIIDGIIMSAWWLFFNIYMLQAGHSREFLGTVNSLPAVASLIFAIPLGALSDRIGQRLSLMISIIFAGIGQILQLTLSDPTLIMIASFGTGIATTLYIISQAPLMMKLSNRENRTLLFSLNFGLQTLAGAVGSLFAGQLPSAFAWMLNVSADSYLAYRAVLMMSILLGTLAIVPLWMMGEPKGNETLILEKKTKRTFADFKPVGITTLKIATPQALIGFGAAILIPYMNVFFKERFAVSDSLLGIMFSISALLTGIGNLMGPQLAVRLGGKIPAILLTQFTSLIFMMTIGFVPIMWISVFAFLIRGALMNMSAPLYNAFALEQVPEREQGLINSILNLSWSIGWAVGPYVSGVVQERYGFSPLFITTGILYFTALVLTGIFFRKTERIMTMA